MPTTRPPPGEHLGQALGRSEPLSGLMQRVRESQARLAAITSLLPAGLQGEVRAGPLDDAGWVLLVGHAAGAAKLRQLLPSLEAALRDQGWAGPAIKVKVLPRA
jgi:hypothetical protein